MLTIPVSFGRPVVELHHENRINRGTRKINWFEAYATYKEITAFGPYYQPPTGFWMVIY